MVDQPAERPSRSPFRRGKSSRVAPDVAPKVDPFAVPRDDYEGSSLPPRGPEQPLSGFSFLDGGNMPPHDTEPQDPFGFIK